MDHGRGKIPEALMRSFSIIGGGISADLIPGRMFIGITSHDINLFLFGGAEEPLRQGIIGGPCTLANLISAP